MTDFSAAGRHADFDALGAEHWDLLVIGGGVTGAGIAHDAVTRGLRVALVDAGDIGGGTSSRSSRLVHGGLRYLETFGFGLIWESSQERARLLRLAPHLVRPLPFLFPLYRNGPVGKVQLRAGMVLYDLLSAFRNIRGHRMLSAEEVAREEPSLRHEGLIGAALYYDASVDDGRLALAAARAAHEGGAAIVSHAEVAGFVLDDEEDIRGVRVRDRLRPGRTMEVTARVVLNATGPWSDRLRALAEPGAEPRLRTTKGVHLMVPRARVGNKNAITLRSPVDDRVMFVLPWGEFTYVGTTDTDYTGDPRDVAADEDDIAYLLDSANALFPDARLTRDDVLSTWAGVRPLLAPTGEKGESATSREHEIWWDPSGLLNIAGGKLTTFRIMAREAVDEVVRGMPTDEAFGPSLTGKIPMPGAPPAEQAWDDFLAAVRAGCSLGDQVADGLAARHGTDAVEICRIASDAPGLAERIVPQLPYLWAEVVFAVRRERALTLDDVMVRRTHLFYELADGGASIAAEVARRMAAEAGIGWDEAARAAQVAGYLASVRANRALPE